MSVAPDPLELAPTRDPAAYGRRRLLTTGFFAWTGLCLACLIGGAVLGHLLPPLGPHRDDATASEAARRAPAAGDLAASAPTPLAAPPIAPAPSAVSDTPAVAALSERVARLEGAQARVGDAAAAALAAAELSEAAQTTRPFAGEVETLERVTPNSPDLRALAPLAVEGAASRAGLAAALPAYADEASAAAHQPEKGAGLFARMLAAVQRVVMVRRLDAAGGGTDGVLARAEQHADTGDLETALTMIAALPAPARARLAEWTAEAQRRVDIDRHVAALRAQALSDLLQTSGARS